MKVLKRDGSFQELSFDKVLYRLKNLKELEPVLGNVKEDLIAQKVISRIYDGVSTRELDELAAQLSIDLRFDNLEYETLASRIIISNLHKKTPKTFYESMKMLYDAGILTESFINIVEDNKDLFNGVINIQQDYTYDYFAFKTLEKSYLMKVNDKIVETPQYLLLRVAIGVHTTDIPNVILTYNLSSQKYFTHASPTLFNAGTKNGSFASCYLLSVEDSMRGIYKCLSDCAMISKYAGGIGVHISNIRSKGSVIRGTNGVSDGIVKMLKVFNETALYSNQSGKRNGSIAIYIEPWHADILDFVELPLKQGDDKKRARDLFYALWVPDLFMTQVESDGDWYLMCPDTCKGLNEEYGENFETLYWKYVNENKYKKKIKARTLWDKILTTQIETGLPYISYKDAVNKKSNQKNLGTIKSSNLCVAGETLILTETGYHEIKSLVNQEHNVWNGEKFSKVNIVQTGKKQKLIKVKLSNGSSLKCTKYHKFYCYNDEGQIEQIEAKDLKPETRLLECEFPVLDLNTQSSIMNTQSSIMYTQGSVMNTQGSVMYTQGMYKNKNNVKVPYNSSITEKLEWIKMLLEDNITSYNANNNTIKIINIDYSFMYNVFLLFQSLNIKVEIEELFNSNDIYPIECYALSLNKDNAQKLSQLNLVHSLISVVNNTPTLQPNSVLLSVKGIELVRELHNTYCFTENERGMGVFNGILTGQCNEINIYSSTEQYGTCNLASISLPAFIENKTFNYAKLEEIAGQLIVNLNKIIDVTFYSTPESERANKSHRPVGLGVSGFSNVLYELKIPFESQEAKDINIKIFETIYYGSLKMSCELAKKYGPYDSFQGSDFSKGIFQFDYNHNKESILTGRYDWDALKDDIKNYGARNSLLTALMPTASTSQILNNFESFEPITRNIFMRSVLSGDYSIVNRYLIKDLIELGIWNKEFFNKFKQNYGSIQSFKEIPEKIRLLYKDIYEIPQKVLIDLSADRQNFVDQSQSLNIYFQNPTIKKLTSMHFYGWKQGLKTGMYYLRSDSATQSEQFTVEQKLMCSIENKENCEACSG